MILSGSTPLSKNRKAFDPENNDLNISSLPATMTDAIRQKMDASILALGSIHDETPVQFQYRWRCGDSNRAVSSGRLWWEKLFGQNTEKHCDNHIRQGIAHGNVYMHQKPIECKAGGPNYKRTDVHPLFSRCPGAAGKNQRFEWQSWGQIPIQSKGSRLRA